MIKKIICVLLAAVLAFGFSGCDTRGLRIYAADGTMLATISDYTTGTFITEDPNLNAYVDIVYKEAVEILMSADAIDSATAKKNLVNKNYSIHTNFEWSVYDAVKGAYENQTTNNLDFGCAVTNNYGKLIAVYSGGNSEENFAAKATPPYSALKPLSVYAPAIDSGKALWSTLYVDSPIKKVVSSDGTKTDWPINVNNEFKNQKVTLELALKQSLNTVAVKCLMNFGVGNSIEFLKESFNFPLESEEQIVNQYGEEEILGNLGMGYLREGVSPVDMSGYYQIFANGGVYQSPKAINKIKNSSNENVYEFKYDGKQVVKNSTSVVLNQLLQTVVSPLGTGAEAACDDIEIGGKTGTGDLGNWFVGFTPEYSCAVWHGTQSSDNISSKIFADIINSIPNKALTEFAITSDVKFASYCCESGLLKTEKCDDFDTGFYAADSFDQLCNLH